MSLQTRERTLQLTNLVEELEKTMNSLEQLSHRIKLLSQDKDKENDKENNDDDKAEMNKTKDQSTVTKPFSNTHTSNVSTTSWTSSPSSLSTKINGTNNNGTNEEDILILKQQYKQLSTQFANAKELLKYHTTQSGGLLSNAFRKKLWPFLVNDTATFINRFQGDYAAQIYDHKEKYQVKVDVDRSFIFLPNLRPSKRDSLRSQLANLIDAILCIHSDLHYFQGYHDIVSVLLLVLGEKHAFVILEFLSITKFRDFMNKNLEGVIVQLQLLFPLIKSLDPELYDFIIKSGVEPHFALSWILTWFSHVVDDASMLARLFDLFLASHPLMPLYLAAAIIIHFKHDILEGECEYTAIYGLFTKLPQSLPFDETLIPSAVHFSESFPPWKLLKFAKNVEFAKKAPHTFRLLQEQFPELDEKLQEKKRQERNLKLRFYSISFSILAVAAFVANVYITPQLLSSDSSSNIM